MTLINFEKYEIFVRCNIAKKKYIIKTVDNIQTEKFENNLSKNAHIRKNLKQSIPTPRRKISFILGISTKKD